MQLDHTVLSDDARLSWGVLSIKQTQQLQIGVQVVFREGHNHARAGIECRCRLAACVLQKLGNDGGNIIKRCFFQLKCITVIEGRATIRNDLVSKFERNILHRVGRLYVREAE